MSEMKNHEELDEELLESVSGGTADTEAEVIITPQEEDDEAEVYAEMMMFQTGAIEEP